MMDITEQKQAHRHEEKTCGYQWCERWGQGQNRKKGLRVTNY